MPHSPMAHDMGMGMGIAHNLNLKFKLFQNIFFEKTYKISFNILGLVLFYVLNTFEPLGIPKTHRKEQKSHIIYLFGNFDKMSQYQFEGIMM